MSASSHVSTPRICKTICRYVRKLRWKFASMSVTIWSVWRATFQWTMDHISYESISVQWKSGRYISTLSEAHHHHIFRFSELYRRIVSRPNNTMNSRLYEHPWCAICHGICGERYIMFASNQTMLFEVNLDFTNDLVQNERVSVQCSHFQHP